MLLPHIQDRLLLPSLHPQGHYYYKTLALNNLFRPPGVFNRPSLLSFWSLPWTLPRDLSSSTQRRFLLILWACSIRNFSWPVVHGPFEAPRFQLYPILIYSLKRRYFSFILNGGGEIKPLPSHDLRDYLNEINALKMFFQPFLNQLHCFIAPGPAVSLV